MDIRCVAASAADCKTDPRQLASDSRPDFLLPICYACVAAPAVASLSMLSAAITAYWVAACAPLSCHVSTECIVLRAAASDLNAKTWLDMPIAVRTDAPN